VNERNAIVVVTRDRRVFQVFQNPPDPLTRLRNNGPLEFPASPFLSGRRLCVTHADNGRRDNFPPTGGEVTPAGPDRAKVSCADQELPFAGLPVPPR